MYNYNKNGEAVACIRTVYGGELMHKDHKYIDKKMVKGKMRYYYDTASSGVRKKASEISGQVSEKARDVTRDTARKVGNRLADPNSNKITKKIVKEAGIIERKAKGATNKPLESQLTGGTRQENVTPVLDTKIKQATEKVQEKQKEIGKLERVEEKYAQLMNNIINDNSIKKINAGFVLKLGPDPITGHEINVTRSNKDQILKSMFDTSQSIYKKRKQYEDELFVLETRKEQLEYQKLNTPG